MAPHIAPAYHQHPVTESADQVRGLSGLTPAKQDAARGGDPEGGHTDIVAAMALFALLGGLAIVLLRRVVERFAERLPNWLSLATRQVTAQPGHSVVQVCALGIGGAIAFSRTVTQPLGNAVRVSQAVASGDLTVATEVRGKDDASPVTEADERAEALILQALAALTPRVTTLRRAGLALGPVEKAKLYVVADGTAGEAGGGGEVVEGEFAFAGELIN